MGARKSKINIPMVLACVLLCLTLITTHLTGGLFARYTSSATAQDQARVARFEVSVADTYGQLAAISIEPDSTVEKYFTVTNSSEVAVVLRFQVSSRHSNLPLEFQHLLSAVVAPGETKEVPLLITWPGEHSSDQYIGMVDLLHITVQVEQVD